MTGLSLLRRKAQTAAATLVLVTSVAGQLVAQGTVLITGTVRNAVTNAPLANAHVRVVSGRRSAYTRGDGTYRLVADAGQSEIHVMTVGFAAASRIVSLAPAASTIMNFALQPSARSLDEVATVGTRALERAVAASPVPVDVISSELLENTGATETWQQLQQLVPSVNVPHIPIGDNQMRPVTLRGLEADHVLVLVNGKRRHPASVLLAGPSVPSTALTDLNAIPSSAIERIEVLRDGAAAQYGSDAIAGVVNVVLKSGAHRELQTSVGEVYSVEGGRHFRDGRLFDASTTLGFVSANGGHLTVAGELHDRGGTNRAYPDERPQYFTGDPRNEAPPRVSSYHGDGALHALTLFFTGAVPIAGSIEAYAFGGVADRDGLTPDGLFRTPADARTVRSIYPDGLLPRIGTGTSDLSALAGARGPFRGWQWDASSGWGGNRTSYHVHDSNNPSLGAASPTEFYAGNVAAQQWTSNVDVSRDVRVGSVPMSVAGGAEFRVETYQIRAGDSASWRDGGQPILDGPQKGRSAPAGAQGMLGFRPTDELSARRSNSALYLEADGRPVRRLLLQSAVRAEHYSDFGSTSAGKVAGRVELLPGLALRASASTGFRAPALSQQYFSSTRTQFQLVNGATTVLSVRTFPVNTPEAELMGATPLRPEKSVSQSAGLVLSAARLPVITADIYRIDVRDRLSLGGAVTDTSIIRLFEENGMRGVGGGNYFTNSKDTRTQGVDLVASQSFLFAGSHALQVFGGYNHTHTHVTRVAPPPPQLARFQSTLFNRTAQGVIENGQPGETLTLTLNYSAGPVGLNLHNQRSGPTAQLDQNDRAGKDQVLHPKWITDVRFSYQLRRQVQLSLSVMNLFDVYPDEWWDFKDGVNAAGTSFNGIFRYPGGLSPFGMDGRTLYLALRYR
jgi:iron complex outermembrane recepter protein